jgi:poly-gamma-glutamate capsule biosynthesis protein CapA/YwtB (metallophosphatase superfamily)
MIIKPKLSRKVVIAAFLLFVVGGGGFVYAVIRSDMQTTNSFTKENTVQAPATTATPNEITLAATGDMLPHATVNQAAKTESGYDYTQFFTQVSAPMKQADISFCNQESPSAASLSVTGYPSFNAPPQFSKDLANVGCNLISLANNHSYDKGQAGINGTLDTWDGIQVLAKTGINRSGAEQSKISYFEKKGVKFAFLAYTDCSNNASAPSTSVNPLQKSLVDVQVAEAKQQSDMIIVSTHWCKENISQQTAAQDTWAQYFADKGVQIVIGTGPHFLQPVKKLPRAGGGDTVVWFSLGNFLSTQEEINGLIGGIATMKIDVKQKNVTELSFLPTYMHYEWTASEKAAGDLLKRKNLMLYPLNQAAAPLAKSQNGTTVEAQTKRVTDLINTYTQVKIDKL